MINIIKSRRSIRKFRPEEINIEQLNSVLEAAMYAPSARNKQPWQFVVIRDRDRLNGMVEIHPYAAMLKEASCCIIVCGDLTLEESKEYAAINCAAATQNILIALHSLGLGGVWLGVYPREERMNAISDFLKLPDHIFPFCAIAAGHPDEKPVQPERFRQDRIHFEKIGS